MDRVPLELVTIVAETVLEEPLKKGLLERGATGYTVTPTHGRGSRGIRSGDVPGESIRIDIVVDTPTSELILGWIQETYFPNYAVIVWVTRAEVLRGEKYLSS